MERKEAKAKLQEERERRLNRAKSMVSCFASLRSGMEPCVGTFVVGRINALELKASMSGYALLSYMSGPL